MLTNRRHRWWTGWRGSIAARLLSKLSYGRGRRLKTRTTGRVGVQGMSWAIPEAGRHLVAAVARMGRVRAGRGPRRSCTGNVSLPLERERVGGYCTRGDIVGMKSGGKPLSGALNGSWSTCVGSDVFGDSTRRHEPVGRSWGLFATYHCCRWRGMYCTSLRG